MKQQLDRYFELLPLLLIITVLVAVELLPPGFWLPVPGLPTGFSMEMPRLILR